MGSRADLLYSKILEKRPKDLTSEDLYILLSVKKAEEFRIMEKNRNRRAIKEGAVRWDDIYGKIYICKRCGREIYNSNGYWLHKSDKSITDPEWDNGYYCNYKERDNISIEDNRAMIG
jgi:hypothetical protein